MKQRIPFLSTLCLAALAVFFIWPSVLAQAEEPTKAVEAGKKAEAEGDKKKGGPDDTSGGRFAGDPIYIHMPPMVLPVISNRGAEQLVTLVLDVQVKDFDASDALHANMPRVQDALMRALYGGLGQGTLRNGKLVDVTKIKAKAVAAVSEVIGADNVRDVLVQGVSQRLL